jgi:hypothetical protein
MCAAIEERDFGASQPAARKKATSAFVTSRCQIVALNVVCWETAIRLESGRVPMVSVKRKSAEIKHTETLRVDDGGISAVLIFFDSTRT